MSRILRQAAAAKGADLESWETALRGAVLQAGANALGVLLNEIGRGRRGEKILCECGGQMESQGLKGKQVLTILGAGVIPAHDVCVCGMQANPVSRRRRVGHYEHESLPGTATNDGACWQPVNVQRGTGRLGDLCWSKGERQRP